MATSIETAKRRGQLVVQDFNKRFTPNTPCFYQPVRGEDKWYPTRTRSEAWLLGHGEPVVKVDGASGCVCISHLAMPGSDRYEASIAESEEARATHNTQRLVADDGLTVSEVAQKLHDPDWEPFPGGEPERPEATSEPAMVYQYAVWLNTERGQVHHDGVITLPMIKDIRGYLNARQMIADDLNAIGVPVLNPIALNVSSLCIVGEVE